MLRTSVTDIEDGLDIRNNFRNWHASDRRLLYPLLREFAMTAGIGRQLTWANLPLFFEWSCGCIGSFFPSFLLFAVDICNTQIL